MTRVNDYVSSNALEAVDYIKMDIEGSELDALDGASESIKKIRSKTCHFGIS